MFYPFRERNKVNPRTKTHSTHPIRSESFPVYEEVCHFCMQYILHVYAFLSFFLFFSVFLSFFIYFSPSSQRLGLIPSFLLQQHCYAWSGGRALRAAVPRLPLLLHWEKEREKRREGWGGVRKRERQTDSVSRRMEEQFVRARVREREREREHDDSEYMRAPAHGSPD